MKRTIVLFIPSAITLCNLSLGFIAILINDPLISGLLILCGALLDVFDGMAARVLNASSELGKQLDSMADLVTFGIAPAFLFYQLLPHSIPSMIIAALIPAGAALRLARFNLDTEQTYVFKGLPSPANGIFFATLPWFFAYIQQSLDYSPLLLLGLYLLPALGAFFMNCNFLLFSFKSLKFGWKKNNFLIAFLALIILMAIVLKSASIPLIIPGYLLISLIFQNQLKRITEF